MNHIDQIPPDMLERILLERMRETLDGIRARLAVPHPPIPRLLHLLAKMQWFALRLEDHVRRSQK